MLTLDDATQRAIQAGQATLSAYVPIAPQFDLREQRDIGIFRITLTPTPLLDVTGSFTNQRHIGELPWGASFGFGNDVEVALPYRSGTNDFTSEPSGPTAAGCCASPTTAPGSTTTATRWSGTARSAWTTHRARRDAAA